MTETQVLTPGVAQVRRYYELVDDGDIPGLVDLFTSDATYHRPGYEPIHGHAGLTAFYREDRPIRAGAHRLNAIVAAGQTVAVHGEFHGVLRDDRPVDLRFADFFVLSGDGRFARRDTFFYAPLA